MDSARDPSDRDWRYMDCSCLSVLAIPEVRKFVFSVLLSPTSLLGCSEFLLFQSHLVVMCLIFGFVCSLQRCSLEVHHETRGDSRACDPKSGWSVHTEIQSTRSPLQQEVGGSKPGNAVPTETKWFLANATALSMRVVSEPESVVKQSTECLRDCNTARETPSDQKSSRCPWCVSRRKGINQSESPRTCRAL